MEAEAGLIFFHQNWVFWNCRNFFVLDLYCPFLPKYTIAEKDWFKQKLTSSLGHLFLAKWMVAHSIFFSPDFAKLMVVGCWIEDSAKEVMNSVRASQKGMRKWKSRKVKERCSLKMHFTVFVFLWQEQHAFEKESESICKRKLKIWKESEEIELDSVSTSNKKGATKDIQGK